VVVHEAIAPRITLNARCIFWAVVAPGDVDRGL
jgi:hypothetical protein